MPHICVCKNLPDEGGGDVRGWMGEKRVQAHFYDVNLVFTNIADTFQNEIKITDVRIEITIYDYNDNINRSNKSRLVI